MVKSGTRLCLYISETRNIVVSEATNQSYVLKTGNGKLGSLKIVSEFTPPPSARIIGLELLVSTILLEIILGERRDDFVDFFPGLKLKWPQKHANQRIRVIVQETPRVQFTLQDIQHETGFRLLNLDKLFIGPVSLKRLRFTPGELSSDQTAVIIGQ